MLTDNVTPDRLLDVRGKVCPYPTVEMQKVLNEMETGQILEVVSDYMPARTTMPFICWRQKYPWALIEDDNGQFRVLVKKEVGESPPPPSIG